MENTKETLNKYILIVNEQFHNFLKHFIKQKHKIDLNFKDRNRTDIIKYLEEKNPQSNRILIKNLEEKEVIDFRTTIFLLNQVYFDNKNNSDNIRCKFFQQYLSELMNLPVLIREYFKINKNCDELIERLFQNIYFVFKFIKNDLPIDQDLSKLFEINRYFKLLMIKNSLSSSAYELDIIKQDIPRLESVLTEKRRIELFKIIKNSEIKSKPKENTVDDNS